MRHSRRSSARPHSVRTKKIPCDDTHAHKQNVRACVLRMATRTTQIRTFPTVQQTPPEYLCDDGWSDNLRDGLLKVYVGLLQKKIRK